MKKVEYNIHKRDILSNYAWFVKPLIPKDAKYQNSRKKKQISFCKIMENKCKSTASRFHLNGHTAEFSRQAQKFKLHYLSPLLTLGN